jgi:hypothetical protein
MPRPIRRPAETTRDDWAETFARMAVFAFLLLGSTALFRSTGWLRQIAAAPILDPVRNWAALLATVALPLYVAYAWLRRRLRPAHFDLRRALLLFTITVGAISLLLVVRCALATSASCLPVLDFIGGLLLPMLASFTLIMLPNISLPALRRTAKVVAACWLLGVTALAFTPRANTVHAAPANPPAHTQPLRDSLA